MKDFLQVNRDKQSAPSSEMGGWGGDMSEPWWHVLTARICHPEEAAELPAGALWPDLWPGIHLQGAYRAVASFQKLGVSASRNLKW